MATYLKFHQLERSPFEGAGSDRLVLATEALRRAYAEIRTGLDEGAARICLGGGPGIGKSSLARALPKLLASDAACVLVRDPSRDWAQVKATIIKQLCLEAGQLSRASLVQARGEGRRIVLIIDEAEALPAESLEHLDVLLGYRDDGGHQLVQCILLANLEGAPRGQDVPLLWWLDKLTTRQLTLAPIPLSGIRSYVDKHLKKAGASDGSIFEDEAIVAIHRYTGGVPGAVSALCEQLLGTAATRGSRTVTAALVARVFGDTPPSEPSTTPERAEPEARAPTDAGLGIDHSNTPPTAEETLSGEGLPQFHARVGERASERLASRADARAHSPAEPESDLQVQQGLLPVQESSNYASETDFFADVDTESEMRVRKDSSYAAAATPGRGEQLVSKLIRLAFIAVLAVAVHAAWSRWGGTALELWGEILGFTPPSLAELEVPAPGAQIVGELAAQAEESVGAVLAADPEESSDSLDEAGLTSDLKLDPTARNEAPLEARGGLEAATPAPGTTDDPVLSLDELYEIAEQADAAPAEPEPWTQQGPEAVPAAPRP